MDSTKEYIMRRTDQVSGKGRLFSGLNSPASWRLNSQKFGELMWVIFWVPDYSSAKMTYVCFVVFHSVNNNQKTEIIESRKDSLFEKTT